MLEKFLPRDKFESYEDFKKNYKVNIPGKFNFAYDVVDAWAMKQNNKRAMVWCNDHGDEKIFTFGDLKRLSDKAANLFKSLGIGKGDVVLLTLKRRWQFWICILGLEKIGAVAVPATAQLTKKDIAYRNNAASVKMIISIAEDYDIRSIESAMAESPTVIYKALVGATREGWLDFDAELEKASDQWDPPTGSNYAGGEDPMLMYFTSGTTGMPKMVLHDYYHPLGHIVTAHYWQRLSEDGLHLTVSDSGWAKCGWGKIYGQWICGVSIFVYDMDRFVPENLLNMMVKYKITSFCAPPTIYRFFIKEDLSQYDLSSIKIACTAGEPLNPEVFYQFKKATGLFKGYYRDEAVTRKVWHDGTYNTGDVAWRDEDGYFWFVGRSDDVIKCSGYRIGPFEVESALLEHPSVLECAVTAVPDPVRGQVVKATVVLTKGYEPSEQLIKQLQDHVKKVTAPYKYPRVVEFVKELPKTVSGKIRRVEIRTNDEKKS